MTTTGAAIPRRGVLIDNSVWRSVFCKSVHLSSSFNDLFIYRNDSRIYLIEIERNSVVNERDREHVWPGGQEVPARRKIQRW